MNEDKKKPEIVSRHKTTSLRLLHSCPDLVRTVLFHEVPGNVAIIVDALTFPQGVNSARSN